MILFLASQDALEVMEWVSRCHDYFVMIIWVGWFCGFPTKKMGLCKMLVTLGRNIVEGPY